MKKVAAYARVSTSHKNQELSLEYQTRYWNETLMQNKEYDYIGLYADKGISGKYAERRPQLMALLEEANKGNVELIFTKSVQRFARNTEELLKIVRELREKEIYVVFEKENINTSKPDSDLYLTIAAGIAEDDLIRYSANIQWTIQDKIRNGENVMGYILYGYNVINNRVLEVNEEQAKIVKEVFEMYATGKISSNQIASYLNEKEVLSAKGKKWSDSTIRNMLRNEKYKGDILLQKFYTKKGKKIKNNGEKDQYYVENDHEGIISKELWDKVQEVINKRSLKKLVGKESRIYPFTSLIKCGKCGANYQHKIANSGSSCECGYYTCSTYKRYGKDTCDNSSIKEKVINQLFVEAYNDFVDDKYNGTETNIIKNELNKLYDAERDLNQLMIQGFISKDNYELEHNDLKKKINELETNLEEINMRHVNTNNFKKQESFDENTLHKFIKEVIIQNRVVTFVFYNGAKIKKVFNNGERGNKEVWKLAKGGRK